MKDARWRSIFKALSWRVFATIATILLVYFFTGKLILSLEIGLLEVIIKLMLYYGHERLWNRIKFGKGKIEPFVLWFTGLSGSGKSTLAERVYRDLSKWGYNVERLDGDTVRSIFSKTGFSKEERNDHIKRIGFLASMLEKNGIIVIASFISPYEENRDFVRKRCKNFVLVHVKASLEECERRDVKGLYQKARKGEIRNFTGIDDPFEEPVDSELVLDTETESEKQCYGKVLSEIKKYLRN